MALSSVVKHFTDGTLAIEDGSGTPISKTISFANGDLSVEGLQHKLREVIDYEVRGTYKVSRHGARIYPSFSFTAMMTDFTEATTGTLLDMIAKDGAFGSAVSTLGANADVMAYKVTWTVEGTDYGDGADGSLIFNDCVLTASIGEGQPNTITISGSIKGSIGGDIALAEG